MNVSKEFFAFAIADNSGNTWLGVCADLNDLINIQGLKDSDGEPLYFYNKAEHILEWVAALGFKCVATKRTIEVEIF